jgi:hypothetical protein
VNPHHFEFFSGMTFGFRREQALYTFIEAIGQVRHWELNLKDLGLQFASGLF